MQVIISYLIWEHKIWKYDWWYNYTEAEGIIMSSIEHAVLYFVPNTFFDIIYNGPWFLQHRYKLDDVRLILRDVALGGKSFS